jgi:hypothetical protein
MVECRSKDRCVQNGRRCHESISHYCDGLDVRTLDRGWKDLQGKRCLNRGTRERYRAASAMLGYGVKMANTPVRVHATNNGCLCSRMVRPGIYEAACSQKTPKKNSRNESNISMKKYHQRPTLGVRSGSRSRTPYVAAIKSHEPVIKADVESNAPITTARPKVCTAVKVQILGFVFVFMARVS